MTDDLIGKALGRYRLLEKLGEGGMAVVYKALDTSLERHVAIKVILPYREHSDKFLTRFKREARALAKLSHPNILKIFDYGEFDNQPYLVMEYIPGGTLKDWLKGEPVPWQKAAQILTRVARALEVAHSEGIIHRDVKPANILLANGRDPMLSDFGIAKLIEGSDKTTDLTGTGVGIGTPDYMAPEQGVGMVDERADIYALGVIFYQLVTGRLPFEADTPLAVMLKKNTEPLPRPTQYVHNLPAIVENVLTKALARDPLYRYKDMGEFAVALERLNSKADTLETNTEVESGQMTVEELSQPPFPKAVAEGTSKERFPGTTPSQPITTSKGFFVGVAAILLIAIAGIGFRVINGRQVESPQPTETIVLQTEEVKVAIVPSFTQEPKNIPPSVVPTQSLPVKLAYVVGETTRDRAVIVSDSTGSNGRKLTGNDCDNAEPDWAPDGSYLVYQSMCMDSLDIWRVNADGSNKHVIISEPNYDEGEPHFSPSGDKLVYVRRAKGQNYNTNSDIRIYEFDGDDYSTGLLGRGPVYSPDGDHLAFMALDGSVWQIFTYDFSAKETRQITFSENDCRWPAWSPNGDFIVFNSATGGGSTPTGIWVVSANGDNLTPVISNGYFGRPDWSESGWIVINSNEGLWVIRPDGTGRRQITNDTGQAGVWSR